MDATLLFPLAEGMLIEDLEATETSLSLTVRATCSTSCCPLCKEASSSIHSHSQRTLSDASCAGRKVQLCLTVRRFYCRNRLCERKVFWLACVSVTALSHLGSPHEIWKQMLRSTNFQ